MKALNRSFSGRIFTFIVVVFAILFQAKTASARTVYTDDFSSDTIGAAPLNWYSITGGSGGSAPTVATKNSSPLSGNTVYFAWNNASIVSNFSSVTLSSSGDYIQVSCDLLYSTLPSNASSGPALGLYNSNGTYQTTNLGGSNNLLGNTTDDVGYKMYKILASTSDLYLVKNATGFGGGNASGTPTALSSTDSTFTLTAATAYTMTLKIALAANLTDLIVTYNFNGTSQSTTVSGTNVATYTYDEVALQLFGNGGGQQGYVDNISVITNVAAVPEPSIYFLIGLGAAVMGFVINQRKVKVGLQQAL